MNDLAILERQLEPLAPRFEQVLGNLLPVGRLIQSVLISVERTPKLLDCRRETVFQAAMSAACLGLPIDGVTGQAFMIPFKDRAQLIIGYKGYSSLAARADMTLTGGVVREGDAFDFEKGSAGFVRHKPLLNGTGRRIIAAWAVATHLHRPPIVEIMGIDEILAVKDKSPGARKSDSPWNDPAIGFPAMAEKTPKRRLARSMPLSVMQVAARLDEAVEEQGRPAWITPERGLEIEGEAEPIGPYEESPTPTMETLTENPTTIEREKLKQAALNGGTDALRAAWEKIARLRVGHALAGELPALKALAANVDESMRKGP
jgi:recombination protein RecT